MKPVHIYVAAGLVIAAIVGVQAVPAMLSKQFPEEGTPRWRCIEKYGYDRWDTERLDVCESRLRLGLKVY